MGTYDGYWEMYEDRLRDEREKEQAKRPKYIPSEYNHLIDTRPAKEKFAEYLKDLDDYWIIIDKNGNQIAGGKYHKTENSAWLNLTSNNNFFDKDDYVKKGCMSKLIEIQHFKDMFNDLYKHFV